MSKTNTDSSSQTAVGTRLSETLWPRCTWQILLYHRGKKPCEEVPRKLFLVPTVNSIIIIIKFYRAPGRRRRRRSWLNVIERVQIKENIFYWRNSYKKGKAKNFIRTIMMMQHLPETRNTKLLTKEEKPQKEVVLSEYILSESEDVTILPLHSALTLMYAVSHLSLICVIIVFALSDWTRVIIEKGYQGTGHSRVFWNLTGLLYTRNNYCEGIKTRNKYYPEYVSTFTLDVENKPDRGVH